MVPNPPAQKKLWNTKITIAQIYGKNVFNCFSFKLIIEREKKQIGDILGPDIPDTWFCFLVASRHISYCRCIDNFYHFPIEHIQMHKWMIFFYPLGTKSILLL